MERFADYIKHMKSNESGDKTIERYVYILDKLPEGMLESISGAKDVESLETWMKENPSPFDFFKNYRLTYFAIKSYLNFLNKKAFGELLDKKAKEASAEKKNTVPRYWDKDMLDRFIKSSRSTITKKDGIEMIVDKPLGEADRDELFVKTLVSIGCRCGEALKIRIKDIDQDRYTISIQIRKDKTKELFADEDIIKNLIHHAKRYDIKDDDRIFDFLRPEDKEHKKLTYFISLYGNTSGKKMFIEWISLLRAEYMIGKIGRVIEKDKKLNPESVRLSIAALLKKSNTDTKEIKDLMGHSSMQTTKRMLDNI